MVDFYLPCDMSHIKCPVRRHPFLNVGTGLWRKNLIIECTPPERSLSQVFKIVNYLKIKQPMRKLGKTVPSKTTYFEKIYFK